MNRRAPRTIVLEAWERVVLVSAGFAGLVVLLLALPFVSGHGPQGLVTNLKVVFGIPVMILPGYAISFIAIPNVRPLERLAIASGISASLAICSCVFLAASPFGLHVHSVGFLFGVITMATATWVLSIGRRVPIDRIERVIEN